MLSTMCAELLQSKPVWWPNSYVQTVLLKSELRPDRSLLVPLSLESMAPSPAYEKDDDEIEGEDEEEAPSHLPLAPPSESEDISTVDPSYIISLIRKLLPYDVTKVNGIDDTDHSDMKDGKVDDSEGQSENSVIRDVWEDCGCVLWDLSANRYHAEFMVNNLLLEVLLANLNASKSFRVAEICLGIIGNLACHSALSEIIVSQSGLIETVVEQLFLDDSTCLSETFRLLAVSLQGSEFATWAAALLPEQVLKRILWIVGNTLNSTLLERGVEFLLAIVDKQEVARVLLPPLTELDMPNHVVGLLTCEINKLRDENKLERSSILDTILGLVESLSAMASYSQAFSSHKELFHLVCGMIKFPDKIEVASSCISAVIVIANLMVDDPNLTSVLSQDFVFLLGLVDMFPFVSDEPQARNALWFILARFLAQVEADDISKSTLHQLVSLFLDKFHLIKDDLEDHDMQDSGEDQSLDSNEILHEMTSSLRRIEAILERSMVETTISSEEVDGCGEDISKVQRLLRYLRQR